MPYISVGKHTPDTLQNLIDDLEKALADLRGVRASMKALRIAQVDVKGQSEMERALVRIAKFARNAEESVQDEKMRSGGFGVATTIEVAEEPPANGTSKKKGR